MFVLLAGRGPTSAYGNAGQIKIRNPISFSFRLNTSPDSPPRVLLGTYQIPVYLPCLHVCILAAQFLPLERISNLVHPATRPSC